MNRRYSSGKLGRCLRVSAQRFVMYRVLAIVLCVTLAFVCAATTVGGQERQIKVGLGSIGPISPHTVYDIERIIGAEPNIHVIPIQPPGGVDACVRRFVAGEPDDRLDAVMVVSLPSDSFQTEREGNQARFTGTYEIWTLNLSTLAEDRHTFTVCLLYTSPSPRD